MPASSTRQHHPSRHYVSSDCRSGDRRSSQTGTPRSGHHLNAYKRSHTSSQYPDSGGAASAASFKSWLASNMSERREYKAPTMQSSLKDGPKHGFSRTHDGGYYGKPYWGCARASSVASTRSDISGGSSADRSSHRTFPRNKTELNVTEMELDRIKGFSRKPNGGYWKDRMHQDPLKTRPYSARSHSAHDRWESQCVKLSTPRAAFSARGAQAVSNPDISAQIFDKEAADPSTPKSGYTRTYWGSYYRDPHRGIETSRSRAAQSSVPPAAGFTRSAYGGFFRGKTYEAPDLGNIDASAHFDRGLPLSSNREADPAAPGPGYTRTNYGGFYIREKQYAE